mgnify:FL=1
MVDSIKVQVVYAESENALVVDLELTFGSTVEEALAMANLLDNFKQAKKPSLSVGIFGKLVSLNDTLDYGDRIEIYRSLQFDPKDLRRNKCKIGQQKN